MACAGENFIFPASKWPDLGPRVGRPASGFFSLAALSALTVKNGGSAPPACLRQANGKEERRGAGCSSSLHRRFWKARTPLFINSPFSRTYTASFTESNGRPVVSDSATPRPVVRQAPLSGESPCESTGAGCHSPLQGIFPTRGLSPGLPHALLSEPPGKPMSGSHMPREKLKKERLPWRPRG